MKNGTPARSSAPLHQIAADTVRYIKLGRGGIWEDAALDRGELHFGYGNVEHDLALQGDLKRMRQHLTSIRRKPRAAARDAQEIWDFYNLGSNCLWVTFAQDHLWWTFAEPEVVWIGREDNSVGERVRKTIGGWRNTDVNGVPLRIDALSTRLTKVGSYQRTICAVAAREYLLRRINGIEDPITIKGAVARAALIDVLVEAFSNLHWRDFETLVDIMFARSGWHRASAIGGTQKLVDLELEQPTTNELAAVQIKSSASQKTLNSYIQRVDETQRYDRFFFVCHSPKSTLVSPGDRPDVYVWAGRELAAAVLKMGLHDWVLERIA